MALLDHRVFRCGDQWWVAQVYSASGLGVGLFYRERVTFTCMSDIDAPSREHQIGAGSLNHLSHVAICRYLERAKPQGDRFEMCPFNAPDEQAVVGPILVDDEGLRWVKRRSSAIVVSMEREARPSLELMCLDDSALYKEVAFTDVVVMDQYLTSPSEEGLRSLIQMVKEHYIETDTTL